MSSDSDRKRPRDTIFALASGRPPAGVAVVRLSGPGALTAVERLTGRDVPPARTAVLRTFVDPATGELVDHGLVIAFLAPRSFTGEDAAEFHLHGGPAVVAGLLAALAALPGLRPAEPGEFTRRAFENGMLDLTAVEGLADLVAAETVAQRRQALQAAGGALARRVESWRAALLRARAAIEADLDFADEDDVPGSVAEAADGEIAWLERDVALVLADAGRGERIRDGFRVALVGPPNAGKSSLLNALARREAAIVAALPGTTRDIVEVHLDLGGVPVIVSDTAGIRETADPVEQEGVRRARDRARAADLVLWLTETGEKPPPNLDLGLNVVVVRSKSDLAEVPSEKLDESGSDPFPPAISVVTGIGLARLEAALAARAAEPASGDPALVTRARQRHILDGLLRDLAEAGEALMPEVRAEALRRASDRLGRLTGRIDVEEVLGAIFSSFCIGK